MRRLLTILGALVAIVVLAGAAFVGWRLYDRDPEIKAADVQPTPELIAKGEYLVKWNCLPYSECTWEDESLVRRKYEYKIEEYE